MVVEEGRRVELFEQLATVIGPEATTTLFELLPGSGARIATSDDVDRLGHELRAEMAGLRSDMIGFREDLRGEMNELRDELRGEMNELRDELRGEMGQLRGATAELRTELQLGMERLASEQREQRAELLATFRAELNDALARNTRTMLVGLVGTLVSTLGLATVLARFIV